MATIHEKRPVVNGNDSRYVDVTLHTGERVQGIAIIDGGGCDFETVAGAQIWLTPDDAGAYDWADIVNAADTSDEPFDAGWTGD